MSNALALSMNNKKCTGFACLVWLSFFFFIATLFCTSCSRNKTASEWEWPGKRQVALLDSTAASKAIIDAHTDGFFDQIGMLDMSIQLGQPLPDSMPRDTALKLYKEKLQREVSNFTSDECLLLRELLDEAALLCQSISSRLLPQRLELIKVKGECYGPGVFYTRENRIIIPASELSGNDREALLRTMLHELFHVYSRSHPHQRLQLYSLIGFRPLDGPLSMNANLQRRRLTNPDGVNCAYAIQLRTPWGQTIQAIPLTITQKSSYAPDSLPTFLESIYFELFRVEQQPDSTYKVWSRDDGSPMFSLLDGSDLYRQISDNTTYIIHPEEIIADNFAILALSHSNRKQYRPGEYSISGKKLLRDVERVLRATRTKK